MTVLGSPPLTRGIRTFQNVFTVSIGITPAHAGNTRRHPNHGIDPRDHPRSRGEYHSLPKKLRCMMGSPPLTRGIHDFSCEHLMDYGITPAHAGNTLYFFIIGCVPGDHPRSRGEYFFKLQRRIVEVGSPPLTRGIRVNQSCRQKRNGITPAHAGNTAI